MSKKTEEIETIVDTMIYAWESIHDWKADIYTMVRVINEDYSYNDEIVSAAKKIDKQLLKIEDCLLKIDENIEKMRKFA